MQGWGALWTRCGGLGVVATCTAWSVSGKPPRACVGAARCSKQAWRPLHSVSIVKLSLAGILHFKMHFGAGRSGRRRAVWEPWNGAVALAPGYREEPASFGSPAAWE